MAVHVRLVPGAGMPYEVSQQTVLWPAGWPLPREGEAVQLPSDRGGVFYVRHVVWHPEGGTGTDNTEPYILLVLSGRRP